MFTREDAYRIALAEINRNCAPEYPAAIIDDRTIERDFGWVFYFNSKRFLETGDRNHSFAGSRLVIVSKYTGRTEMHAGPEEDARIFEDYERRVGYSAASGRPLRGQS